MSDSLDLYYYRKYNKDLDSFSDLDLIHHYITYGRNENRIVNFDTFMQKNEHLLYFDIEHYKKHNTDLNFRTNEEYVNDYLHNRLNDGREISAKLSTFKRAKMDLIRPLLKDPLSSSTTFNFLDRESKNKYLIGLNESESANEWPEDGDISKIIASNAVVLNLGAGYRKNTERYFSMPNVINMEIFNYPTSDVLCSGDCLPFKDNSVDAILSLAVLEHVSNPWEHAAEMIRVLKPGGCLYVDVPFMQPYHGYPHHYFNMTTAGLRSLFEKDIQIVKHAVEPWAKPIYSLTWILQRYCEFLDPKTRQQFENLTVKSIIQNGNNANLNYVKNMDPEKEEIIAAGTTLIGRKKPKMNILFQQHQQQQQQLLLNQVYWHYVVMLQQQQLIRLQVELMQPFSQPFLPLQPQQQQQQPQQQPQQQQEMNRNRHANVSWHLSSHNLFRKAIRRQLLVFLDDPQLVAVKNRLTMVGYDLNRFANALETKLYHEAKNLEEYLEYTTLRRRMCEQLKKVRKVVIRS